jgi:hypothetical protein
MLQLAASVFRGSLVKKFIVVAAAIAAFGLLDGAERVNDFETAQCGI